MIFIISCLDAKPREITVVTHDCLNGIIWRSYLKQFLVHQNEKMVRKWKE